MKILQLAPYSPLPPIFGGAMRIFHLLRGLARRHDVTFVTFGTEHDLEHLKLEFGGIVGEIHVVQPNKRIFKYPLWRMLRALGSGESFYTQYTNGTTMQEKLDQLYSKHHYDVTLLEFPHVGKFRFPEDTLLVLDEHNVEYSNFERMYKRVRSPFRKLLYLREHHKTMKEELGVCRKVGAILATSARDVNILEQQAPQKPKFVVPNGVDVDYFVPSKTELEPYSMVYTGTMDYVPNQDAMFHFLDNIFPLIKSVVPEAKVYIVGKNPPNALKRRNSQDVVVTGFVEDVRPYAWKAAVYVVPLRMGGGTRLKILEGLAMKKAIVTTSIGCEGIDVLDGTHVAIADDPATFAARVVNLLLNRNKADMLGDAGYELVKSRYDWDVIAAGMDHTLTNLLKVAGGHKDKRLRTFITQDATKHLNVPEEDASKAPRSVKVLMYHRIVDDIVNLRSNFWSVTQSQFRRQLALLIGWGFSFVTFQDYLSFQRGKTDFPKKSIILTFDDGYEGVYRHALPVMKEFGAKGTAFILGDRSIKSNVWDNPQGEQRASLMEDEKILTLRDEGFEIGSHSMAHPDLTKLEEKRAWDEIVRSKESLERLIGSQIISFAYPYGASNPGLESMVLQAGYQYACGVYSGPPHFAADRYDIRRIPVKRDISDLQFALRILTPYEYYQWLRWEAGRRFHAKNRRLESIPRWTFDANDSDQLPPDSRRTSHSPISLG